MIESEYLEFSTLKTQFEYLSNYDDHILVPILIDHVPVMLLSSKPYYLCLYKTSDSDLMLCYTSSLKYSRISVKEIRLERLKEYVEESSFLRNVSLKCDAPENGVIGTEHFISLGKNKIGAFNINTEHGELLHKFITKEKGNLSNEENDNLVSYLILQQSKLDTFMRIIENYTNTYKPVSMLNGVFTSNFSLDGRKTYLSEYIEGTAVQPNREQIDGVDVCMSNESTLPVRKTDLLNKNGYLLAGIMPECPITYNVVAMAVSKDDYGRDSVSKLERYVINRNELIVCLIGNDHLYRGLFKNRLNTIYNTRYDAEEMAEGIKVMQQNKQGKVSFQDIITGNAFRG